MGRKAGRLHRRGYKFAPARPTNDCSQSGYSCQNRLSPRIAVRAPLPVLKVVSFKARCWPLHWGYSSHRVKGVPWSELGCALSGANFSLAIHLQQAAGPEDLSRPVITNISLWPAGWKDRTLLLSGKYLRGLGDCLVRRWTEAYWPKIYFDSTGSRTEFEAL